MKEIDSSSLLLCKFFTGEVLNLNCTITDTQAVVHWDEPAVPNGVITGYEVDFAGDNFYDQELLGNQARQVVLPVPG